MRQCSEALFEHPEQIWAFKIAIQGDHFEHLQLDNVIMPSVSEWGGPVGFSITLNGLSYGFYFLLFIYFLMTLLGLRCCVTFSLVVANEDYCLVVALGLLVAVASLVAEQTLGHAGVSSCSSRALEHRLNSVAHRLSCSAACGIFLDQGLNPSPTLAGGFFTTELSGKPYFLLNFFIGV